MAVEEEWGRAGWMVRFECRYPVGRKKFRLVFG